MTPGPTPVPPEVLLAQGSPIVYHRGPGFGAVLRDVTEGLQWIYQTRNDVLTFTCSGSGGMEAAVVNVFSPGDKVLVVSVGNFGQRFVKICKAYGLEVKPLEYEWGKTAKAADVKAALEPDIKGVLIQHSETSTGVINDIEPIGAVVKDHPALINAIIRCRVSSRIGSTFACWSAVRSSALVSRSRSCWPQSRCRSWW